jgi:hypothetical protein
VFQRVPIRHEGPFNLVGASFRAEASPSFARNARLGHSGLVFHLADDGKRPNVSHAIMSQ